MTLIKELRSFLEKLHQNLDDKFFEFELWRLVKYLMFTCWLWDLRGIESCEEHGFHAQNWINGNCRKCEGILSR